MHFIWKILLKLTVLVTSIESENDAAVRNRAHFENFNVLLNLYKMNPLKKSLIYKSFSNHILLPNRDENAALNFDFNESVFNKSRATLSVKQLENIINAKTSNNTLGQPDFNVENLDTENFTIIKKEATVKESSDRKDDFDSIIGPLESVSSDNIPVTKMLPVNTNSVDVQNNNDIFAERPNDQGRNVNEVFSTIVANNMDVAIINSYARTNSDKKQIDDSVVILR